jgi:predicted DNA-binding protein (MmcQ/YjbR family)
MLPIAAIASVPVQIMPTKKRKSSAAKGRDSALAKMREICLALPEAVETETWGQPHFRVRKKIFAGCGEEDGENRIGFKLEKLRAALVLHRPEFRKSKYGGHLGWVSVHADAIEDWDEIEEMVRESYRLIAPKTLSKRITPSSKP